MAKNKHGKSRQTSAGREAPQLPMPTIGELFATACKMIGEDLVVRRVEADRQVALAEFASMPADGEEPTDSASPEETALQAVEEA